MSEDNAAIDQVSSRVSDLAAQLSKLEQAVEELRKPEIRTDDFSELNQKVAELTVAMDFLAQSGRGDIEKIESKSTELRSTIDMIQKRMSDIWPPRRTTFEEEEEAAATNVVLVKATSAASGGGKYNGRILTAPASAALATGTLAESDVGTDPGADDAILLNLAEITKNTHDIRFSGSPTPYQFISLGIVVAVDDSDLSIVVLFGMQWGC